MKVTIKGEVFDFDPEDMPLAETLAFEKATKMKLSQWQAEMQASSAYGLAGLLWLVLHRNGREVPWDDIESGAYPIDVNKDLAIENETPDEPALDPTDGPAEGPDTTTTTAPGTSGRSRKSSGSARGK